MANSPSESKRAVTMRLDKQWLERVKLAARERGLTMTDFVIRAVAREMGGDGPPGYTATPSE